jgi:hypothetical protein
MIKYFQDLLHTLQRIEQHLAKIEEHNERMASCVKNSMRTYGERKYFVTGHWND